jgi:transcriptional regulator with XRE-family HTH domain
MSTSPTSTLFEPTGAVKIPFSTLAYFRARLKHRIYNLIIREFKKSGLSQADLGRRLNKKPAQLSRLLSGPGNLTVDTFSDLLFAISGAEPGLSIDYPLSTHGRGPRVEQTKPQPAPLPERQNASTSPLPDVIRLLQEQRAAPVPIPA